MSTAASLGINTINVDYSKGVAWDDTSLIKLESELLLCLCLVHEILVDSVAVVDYSVGLVLNLSLLILGETLVVSNVEMSTLDGLLSTILPDVRAEDLTARGEHDVSTSVVSTKLSSTLF